MSKQRLRPSVCIDAVLGDLAIGDAVALVAEAGINAFEFWCWWEKDLEAVVAARDAHQMTISSCCTKFISLVDPVCRSEYLEGLAGTVEAATKLEIKTIISQVGDELPGVDRKTQRQSLVDGLIAAVPLLEAADMTLVIEPLNVLVDHAGYFLVRSDEAFEIIDQVGSPNVKVVFDIYHQQISEGHLIQTITSNINNIAHFHAAGNPGRNEITRGEINYANLFQAIRETDYSGFVAMEYWPIADPLIGLKEVAAMFANTR